MFVRASARLFAHVYDALQTTRHNNKKKSETNVKINEIQVLIEIWYKYLVDIFYIQFLKAIVVCFTPAVCLLFAVNVCVCVFLSLQMCLTWTDVIGLCI